LIEGPRKSSLTLSVEVSGSFYQIDESNSTLGPSTSTSTQNLSQSTLTSLEDTQIPMKPPAPELEPDALALRTAIQTDEFIYNPVSVQNKANQYFAEVTERNKCRVFEVHQLIHFLANQLLSIFPAQSDTTPHPQLKQMCAPQSTVETGLECDQETAYHKKNVIIEIIKLFEFYDKIVYPQQPSAEKTIDFSDEWMYELQKSREKSANALFHQICTTLLDQTDALR